MKDKIANNSNINIKADKQKNTEYENKNKKIVFSAKSKKLVKNKDLTEEDIKKANLAYEMVKLKEKDNILLKNNRNIVNIDKTNDLIKNNVDGKELKEINKVIVSKENTTMSKFTKFKIDNKEIKIKSKIENPTINIDKTAFKYTNRPTSKIDTNTKKEISNNIYKDIEVERKIKNFINNNNNEFDEKVSSDKNLSEVNTKKSSKKVLKKISDEKINIDYSLKASCNLDKISTKEDLQNKEGSKNNDKYGKNYEFEQKIKKENEEKDDEHIFLLQKLKDLTNYEKELDEVGYF